MTFSLISRPRIAARVMRGLFLGSALCFGGNFAVMAQQAFPTGLTHALRAMGGTEVDVLEQPAAPFYDVVALRVEFQPDTSRFTTGDGTFSDALYRGLEVSVDPLPHDAGYFEAHLDFLSHYVEHVSDGRTLVTTHLIPEVVRVSQPMAAYSPIGENSDSDAELAKLAALVREAWTLAGAQSSFDISGFDPATTAFALFHAGAGRDIELTGTSLDRTPQDLPSLFFDRASLDLLSPGPPIDFRGFPVRSTMLMPETESRLGHDFIADEDFVAEFSINGFLAASFFSYLGVPDLFNTETGQSAIGPFGLMDPLGIFAFNGLFPPEPSAWTKQYLGWSNPIEISPRSELQEATLGAVSALGFSDAVRVPISGAEYFLVENRQRAAESSDLVLSVYRNGAIVEQRIPLGAENFDRFNIEAFEGGVVVAAEPYDRALPGTSDDGVRYDGGIVIWHIDERILRDRFASNSVNSDPDRRAVDVEEADSGQDIGFGNGGVALGTPFDFWYEGNPATAITQNGTPVRLYENRFGAGTFPSSNTSEGSPSFVELADFSASAASMTFSVGLGEASSGIVPRPGLWREVVVTNPVLGLGFNDQIVRAQDDLGGLLAIQAEPSFESGSSLRIFDDQTGEEILRTYGGQGLAVTPGGEIARLIPGETTTLLELVDRTGIAESYSYNFPLEFSSFDSPSLIAVEDRFYVLAGFESARRVVQIERALDAWVDVDLGLSGAVRAMAYSVDTGVIATDGNTVQAENGAQWTIGGDARGPLVVGTDTGGFVGAIRDRDDNSIVWLLPENTTLRIPSISEFAGYQLTLADLDSDGFLDVVATEGSTLVAYTQSGAVVNGFPLFLPSPFGFEHAQPLVANLTADGKQAVLVVADGSIHAFVPELGGASVPGFPLAVGRSLAGTPLLAGGALFALSNTMQLRAWGLENLGTLFWSHRNANLQNTSSVAVEPVVGGPPSTGLLDDSETYNWPNPIRDGRTFLRFRTDEDAFVSITIVDLSGALIDTFAEGEAPIRGGVPTEVEWVTDAPSGVYFARVTATTASGREESQLIRMAVIR